MQRLYTPWRNKYITRDKTSEGCAFCEALAKPDGPENLIVHRGELAFVILNLYPYSNGHLVIVPYLHTSILTDLPAPTLTEMAALVQRGMQVLTELYKPQGFNLGVNQGAAAGAGIAEHVHVHIVPRWVGDANFISVIGQTRILPETLEQTYARVRAAWM